MIEYGFLFLAIAAVGAFFMAFNNGANDVANSFATAVGAKAITMKQAVLLASILNVLGAILLGGHVAARIIEGIINPAMFASPLGYILAMYAILFAAGTFVLISTLFSMPVSSSHSIVGSLVGVSVVAAGIESVNWLFLAFVAASWVVSPFLAGAMAYVLILVIERTILRSGGVGTLKRAIRVVPILMAMVVGVVMIALVEGTRLKQIVEIHPNATGIHVFESLLLGVLIMIPVYWASRAVVKQWLADLPDDSDSVEDVFKRLQVGTSSYVAFAHGSNDVANSISPVFGVALVVSQGTLAVDFATQTVPFWILAVGGFGIATGIAVLGHKVIKTVGEGITKLTNSRGFSSDVSVASTVVTASLFGLPVSSTHAAIGAVVGVGLQHGFKEVQFSMLGKIVIAWLVTVPSAALLAMAFFQVLSWLFL